MIGTMADAEGCSELGGDESGCFDHRQSFSSDQHYDGRRSGSRWLSQRACKTLPLIAQRNAYDPLDCGSRAGSSRSQLIGHGRLRLVMCVSLLTVRPRLTL